jgi:hypothetical protein
VIAGGMLSAITVLAQLHPPGGGIVLSLAAGTPMSIL